jgi:2-keto-4-pentenoate hydratase
MTNTRGYEAMTTFEQLVTHIDQPGIDADPALDIVKLKPDITRNEALAVQLAVKRRRAAAGDRIVGHQASFTSAGVLKILPDAPRAMVGTLLASVMRSDHEQVHLDADKVFIEAEIGLILKRDLEGPNLTTAEVLAAIEGFIPAIEIAPLRAGVLERAYSYEHMIAVQKAVGGFVILGSRITSPQSFDPRLEGGVVSINGEPRVGATGFEAMGNPLNVVVSMVRQLHAIGEKLHAGQIVITGSLPVPPSVTAGDHSAQAEFQTLGSVSVRFGPRP